MAKEDVGGACTGGVMDTGAEADGRGDACTGCAVDVSRGGAVGWDVGVPGAGTEMTDGRGTGKPGGGGLDPCVPSPGIGVTDGTGWEGVRRGAGAGSGPVPPGIHAGRRETDEGSSSVRKSSSWVGGEGRRREKGNVVSSKTTWREMMTRLVVRSRHL